MKIHQTLSFPLTLAAILAGVVSTHAAPVSTCFSYQGQLRDGNGALINTPHDFRVTLYPQATGGIPVGNPSVNQTSCVPVLNGLFNLTLCFGDPNSYRCEARWLEIAIRPCGSSSFQVMTQRVELLSTPNAIQSLVACTVASNGVSAASIPNGIITSNKIASGQVVKSLNGLRDDVRLVAGNNVTLTPNGQSIQISAAGSSIWNLNGADAYYDSGKVGIGTSSPEQQLSVSAGINLDQGNANAGTVANTLRFGSGSGEAIGSKRTPGGNLFGLDFYTAFTPRLSIRNDGTVTIPPPGNFTWGTGGMLGHDQGGIIELGDSRTVGTVPFVDFHYGVGSDQDYNVRLINNESGWLSVEGNLRASGRMVVDQAGQNDRNVLGNSLTFGPGSGEGIGSRRTPGPGQWGLDFYTAFEPRMTILNNGNVGIGTPAPASKLHVDLNSPTLTGLGIDDSYGVLRFGGPDESYYFRARYKSPFGPFDYLTQFIVRGDGRVGIGTESPKAALHVNGDYYGRGHVWLHAYEGDGSSGTAYVQARDTSGSNVDLQFRTHRLGTVFDTMRLVGPNVGIGTVNPVARLHVVNSNGVGVFAGNLAPFGAAEFESNVMAPATHAHAWFAESGNRVFSVGPGGQGYFAGDVSWGSSSLGLDQNGSIELGNSAASSGVPYIDFHLGVGQSQDFNVRLVNDADGQLTTHGNLHVTGNASVCYLAIRGGCDLAEPFQMSDRDIPKGGLVVIDEENPGKLKLAGQEYDTRVAGIVSGANGVNPGISLHQEGLIEGGQNVALSGRVYALADAAHGAIGPGDLLTSSSTPGHVMKVSDHARAQGAVVGKAMSALKEGKGMVLVLVSLQ